VQSGVELTIGQRIEYMRHRRGFSRRTLASLLGYSDEWLRKVEREGRPVERVSTLLRLADLLQVRDISALVDTGESSRLVDIGQQKHDFVTSAIRHALLQHRIRGTGHERHGDATKIRNELNGMWSTWRTSPRCYSAVHQRLPAMINRLSTTDDYQVNADICRLIARFLLQVGDLHFAQVAVDYALAYLANSRDLPEWYSCVGQWSEVLLRAGSHRESWKLASETAGRMRRSVGQASGDQLTTHAHLNLIAAEAAAATMDHHGAHACLDEAREIIVSGVGDTTLEEPIGVAAVDVIAMRVELALGRHDKALMLADRAEGLHLLCRPGQNVFYLTLASAHLANNDPIATTFALMQVERNCTEEIRFGAEARSVVAAALAQGHDRSTVRRELGGLAERAGIL
jgi:transcriptional regulator with XRE-family HTH domain